MIQLQKTYETNFLDAFQLRLEESQEKFVSSPVRSLAQAYVYRNQCQPFGIYDGDEMVGYVMVIYDYDIPEYDIWHMMIDCAKQGCGYGSAALDRVIDYIRTKPLGDSNRVALTCNKENVLQNLYWRGSLIFPNVRGFQNRSNVKSFEKDGNRTADINGIIVILCYTVRHGGALRWFDFWWYINYTKR